MPFENVYSNFVFLHFLFSSLQLVRDGQTKDGRASPAVDYRPQCLLVTNLYEHFQLL